MEVQKLNSILVGSDSDNELSPEDIITAIKKGKKYLHIPSWKELEKQYDPKLHRIRQDKEWWKDKGTPKKPRRVSRITYPLQRIATKRMTQMAFAIPVRRIYTYDKKDEDLKAVVASIEAVYKRTHIDHLNRNRMKMYFAACELLTIWYAVGDDKGEKHSDYGFETPYKLRCKSYSTMNSYELYPVFDEYDDLLGMCIDYKEEVVVNESTVEKHHFEIFVPGKHIRYTEGDDGWEVSLDENVKIKKLPLAYMYRTVPIWDDQTETCDEIELALSRQSEILRHNSAPYLGVYGEMVKKGKGAGPVGAEPTVARVKGGDNDEDDAVKMVKLQNGGKMEYITWQQSVEAMKYFIAELKKNSEEDLQLPNFSMENVKGLGAVSGEARKTLLTDPHLKVGEEAGEIVIFLEREWKVIVAFLAQMNPKWAEKLSKISCEHVVTPFIQNDEKSEIDKWKSANGGKPLISQRTSIKYSGLVEDPDVEIAEIQQEETDEVEREARVNVFTSAED